MATGNIRLARHTDAARLAAIYAPYVEGTVISFETTPPEPAEMAARLAAVEPYGPWLVYEVGSAVVGYAYLSRHKERAAYQWSADCAVYLDAAWHRRGIGRALYTALFALGRLQGFHAVHAGVTLPNAASVGLHESFGFQPVARYPKVGHKFGAWHDVGWWQLELRARTGPPPAPIVSPEKARAEHGRAWDAAFEQGA